eukprot:TRINITY_DN1730_c0_g1_i1.p1 TRINITY_DN1730_c0_g1~~TRINITY_DN1730_c0_g1_i1.p1  ORF type:complete len:198 (-),score=5.56 TRINITY_DN1730_c0_g1_i1:43-636(-)
MIIRIFIVLRGCCNSFFAFRCKGAWFTKYGDEGHELGYFQKNNNIPQFGWRIIRRLLDSFPEIGKVKPSSNDGQLQWRMTLNFYDKQQKSRAGFPFHRDIDTNGEITTIVTLNAPAIFEFRRMNASGSSTTSHDDATCAAPLLPGSAAMLSGPSRWTWLHRIRPESNSILVTEHDGTRQEWNLPELPPRVSLVFGCS